SRLRRDGLQEAGLLPRLHVFHWNRDGKVVAGRQALKSEESTVRDLHALDSVRRVAECLPQFTLGGENDDAGFRLPLAAIVSCGACDLIRLAGERHDAISDVLSR